jgi:hypothetical protein
LLLSYSTSPPFINEGISAASYCRQVEAWFPVMFLQLYLVKKHKIAKNSTTTKDREKISSDLEFLEFSYLFLTKFKHNPILLIKISHRSLLTIKLFTG